MNIEELIFEMYKNQTLTSAKKFKNDIQKNFKNIDCYDLYRRIVNFQIEKYGCALNTRNYEDYNKEECIQASIRAKQRRYDRKRRK